MTMRPRFFLRMLLYTWAAPTTLVGLFAGLLTLCTGGSVQRRAARSGFMEAFRVGSPIASVSGR